METSYYIATPGSTPRGPFPHGSVIDMYRSGQLPADCLVFAPGMADWQPIETILPAENGAPAQPTVPAKAWGPIVALKTCVCHRLLKFSGRASRSEYWYFALGSFLVSLVIYLFTVAGTIAIFMTTKGNGGAEALLAIMFLPMLFYIPISLAGLSAAVRRLHDVGKSGFWILTTFIPVLGLIFSIVLLFFALSPSDGPNQYGPGPDGPAV